MRLSRWIKRVLVVAAFVAPALPAAAQNICLQLEAQLAILQNGQNDQAYSSVLNQYNNTRAAYDAAYASANQQGCMRILPGRRPPACAAILDQLGVMSAQIDQLQSQLNGLDPGSRSADINNVLRGLGNNNCGPQYAPFADAAGNNGGLLDRLFGVDRGGINEFGYPIPDIASYRTLCVRTCDGSYFPISFATTQAQFATDVQTCQAACPGQQVELFVHLNPGESVEQAVSVGGLPYTSLANAFAFRESYHPECACAQTHVADNGSSYSPVTIDLRAAAQAVANVADPSMPPIPRYRPEPSEDPETVANRAGGFVPGQFTPPAVDPNVAILNEEGMRLVGPAYYYAR